MRVLSSLLAVLLICNATIFVGLTLFRRARPGLRTRLFSWVVHDSVRRRPNVHRHSSYPA